MRKPSAFERFVESPNIAAVLSFCGIVAVVLLTVGF